MKTSKAANEMDALAELLAHIDDAVDASDDAVNVLVRCTSKSYAASVIDAAIAEHVNHGWSVYHGRKAGTWLRL